VKRALVVGLGISGLAASELLIRDGYEVIGVDKRSETLKLLPEVQRLAALGLHIQSENSIDLANYQMMIVSPGIPPTHFLYQEASKRGIEILGEAQFALRRTRQPCIGITGTNGKTTATLLIEHILRSAGKKAKALGNIGQSLTSYFLNPDPDEIIVAELSSYQLETLHAPVIDAGIILNITPDHLDRYSNIAEYARAKCRIQLSLKPNSTFYVHANVLREYRDMLLPDRLSTFGFDREALFYVDGFRAEKRGKSEPQIAYELPASLRGKWSIHDCENASAAWLLTQSFGVTIEQFIQALVSFNKPSHRIEHVANISGVDYYDDSKGTNIDAVIKAVNAMKGQVVLIAGGVDKGTSYEAWRNVFLGKVKKILAIGEARNKIAQETSSFCEVEIVDRLEEAVIKAAACAQEGECVLLSPGCASYDMFHDYAHRGEEFKRFVRNIQKEKIT